jgi:hypothetical protein
MKSEILTAVENNQKVVVYDLIFTSFRNWDGKREYKMQSDRNRDKWEIYNSEKEYVKAIMQRVNYYIKRGFNNVIEIN